jgi:hypothetical protein
MTEIKFNEDVAEFHRENGVKKAALSSHHYLAILEVGETQITFGTEFQTSGHHDSGEFVFRMPIRSDNFRFRLSKPFSLFKFLARGQDFGTKGYKLYSKDVERVNTLFNEEIKRKLDEIPLELSIKVDYGARRHEINAKGELASEKLGPQFNTVVLMPSINVDFSASYQKQIIELLLLLSALVSPNKSV